MPRRILLLLTDLEIGGTPTVVRELAVRLNEPGRGVEVEVACLDQAGPVVEQLAMARVHATPLDAAGVRDLDVVRRLARLLRRARFDTCFSFLMHANAVAAAASVATPGVRLLQSIQTTQPDPWWHWHVQNLAARFAERVVVPSPSAAAVARRWSHVDPAKLVVIPNAIEPAAFAGIGESVAAVDRGGVLPLAGGEGGGEGGTRDGGGVSSQATPQPGEHADDVAPPSSERPLTPAFSPGGRGLFRVGFLGRLDPVKRVDDLIRAAAMLGRRFPLHVFGDGAERGRLSTLVHALGVGDRVTFHGGVGRPQLALQQMDVLVLPSVAEGFGLVLIEAMAAGVPVVATDVAGIRDVVRHERTGLLVPPRNPTALADAIRRVASERSLRDRLVAAGRERVRSHYAWDALLPMYRRLLRIAPAR